VLQKNSVRDFFLKETSSENAMLYLLKPVLLLMLFGLPSPFGEGAGVRLKKIVIFLQ